MVQTAGLDMKKVSFKHRGERYKISAKKETKHSTEVKVGHGGLDYCLEMYGSRVCIPALNSLVDSSVWIYESRSTSLNHNRLFSL